MALRRTMRRLAKFEAPVCGEASASIISATCPVEAHATTCCSRCARLNPRSPADEVCSRMILGIADNDDSASAGFNFVPLGNTFLGVVGTLGMKIRMNFANNSSYILFRKDNDRVNIG